MALARGALEGGGLGGAVKCDVGYSRFSPTGGDSEGDDETAIYLSYDEWQIGQMVTVTERDRIAARNFLREDMARRYEQSRRLSEFEKRVVNEAEALSEYARGRDTRTFCILVGSFLEDAFKANFIEQWTINKKQMADFFGANGPLSTFSQRLIIASGLNWLSPAFQKDARLIKNIRNEMAHNHRVHSLEQEPLLSWVSDMVHVEKTWLKSPDGRYEKAYEAAELETKLRVRMFSQSLMILGSAISNPRLIGNSLPPDYREKGWEGLPDVMRALIDTMIRQAYFAFGIPPSEPDSNNARRSEPPKNSDPFG